MEKETSNITAGLPALTNEEVEIFDRAEDLTRNIIVERLRQKRLAAKDRLYLSTLEGQLDIEEQIRELLSGTAKQFRTGATAKVLDKFIILPGHDKVFC